MNLRWITGLLMAVFAVSGCDPKTTTPEPVIRPVITFTVPEASSEVQRTFAGVVESVRGTNLAFEVGGRVVQVNAKEGQRYQAGQDLARLDTAEFENQLNAAESQRIEARQALRRAQQLFETGNASQGQLEAAIAREKTAESNYKTAKKRLEDTVLKMPYSGVIGTVSIDPGLVVGAGQSVMVIQGEGPKEFEVGIPADLIGRIKTGMRGQITLGIDPEKVFPVKVDSISPEVTQNTTYPVTFQFLQEDERIRDGIDGEVTLTLSNPNAGVLIVPSTCVATLPHAEKYVWRLIADSAPGGIASVQRQVVEAGNLREDGSIEILSGLSPGDVIVSRGVHRLEPNQEVRVLPE